MKHLLLSILTTLFFLSASAHGSQVFPMPVSTVDSIRVPNVFTPNNDGINDVFRVSGLSNADVVKIYNRWGSLVYEFIGAEDAWDGRTTTGMACEAGVYFYFISTSNGSLSGTVQILK